MEDQTSWKAHTFTLVVFAGIVVLCSIFFILGMLVGRVQGQKLALVTSANAAAKTDKAALNEESKPELTFYDSVKQSETSSLEPAADLKIETVTSDRPKPAAVERETVAAPPARTPETVLNYQIGAVRKSGDAE